jgi:hypothetical protein
MVLRGSSHNRAEKQISKPFVKAQINPFNKNAYGAKVPDFNTADSQAFYAYDTLTPTLSTTNAACYAFMPFTNEYAVTATNNVSASTWTWPAAYAGQTATTIQSNTVASFALYRAAAHGIRITSPLTVDTATGFLHIAIYAASAVVSTTWQLPTDVAQFPNCKNYMKIPINSLINNPLTVVNKFLDSQAFNYQDPTNTINDSVSTAASNHSYQGWCTILVAITGAPSGSSPVQIENVIHLEGQPLFSALSRGESAEPSDSLLMDAVSETVAQMNPIFKSPTQETPTARTSEFNKYLLSCLTEVGVELISAAIPGASSYARAGRTALRSAGRYVASRFRRSTTKRAMVVAKPKRKYKRKKK